MDTAAINSSVHQIGTALPDILGIAALIVLTFVFASWLFKDEFKDKRNDNKEKKEKHDSK